MPGVETLTKDKAASREHLPLRLLMAGVLLLLPAATAGATSHEEPTVEELKARISDVSVPDKARLCIRIAEKQLAATDKLYAADDIANAQPALTDVVAYSELARDYSIQSRKHEKQIEIAVRSMTRKLNEISHVLGHDDQGPVRDAIRRLERVRDDLLMSMFPKGVK